MKIERSSAVKCPSIGLHLAGCKKVQQVIARPGQLERFVPDPDHRKQLRSVFAGLYSLDSSEYELKGAESDSASNKRAKLEASGAHSDETGALSFEQVCERAIAHPERYVMKPQREGGGNNIYGQAVSQALQSMTREQLKAFILMERIFPPSQTATLVREGALLDDVTLCELGVYGVYLSDKSGIVSSTSLRQIAAQYCKPVVESSHVSPSEYNKYAGFLLRVKPANSDEGGVAAGYSVLSAPSLTD